MVSNKTNKKAKKPVETSLGKAPSKSTEKDTDVSHLRKPIETSIYGMKQVLSLLETATNEVKHFVMYECDIMYECRVCQSIFRSLANFILHKRNYCREKINPSDCINNNDTYQENVYMFKEKIPSKEDNRSLTKVIEKLQKIEHVKEVAKSVLTEDLSSEGDNQKIRGMDDIERKSSDFNKLVLEKIDSNSSGVFQTLVGSDCSAVDLPDKSTKLEVMEIHKIVENNVPVLDPEGKICGFTSNQMHQTSLFPKSDFNCIECNHRFASQKSLTNHIKCVHNPSRIVYVCPTCKDTFANPWCVYRHLLKVHRMTNKQVRRLREQVHNSWIRRGEESSIQKKKPPESNQGEANSENQSIWSYQRKPEDMSKAIYRSQDSDTCQAIEENDLLNAIPNILTPKPSPYKNEDGSSLSAAISEMIRQSQQKREGLEVSKSTLQGIKDEDSKDVKLNSEENTTSVKNESIKIMDTESSGSTEGIPIAAEAEAELTVDDGSSTNRIKLKEDDDDVNSASNKVENAILLGNVKLEAISEENSRSLSSLSIKSTRSASSPKFSKSLEDLRPRSDSFVSRNALSSLKSKKLFSEEIRSFPFDTHNKLEKPFSVIIQEGPNKARSKSKKLISNTNSGDLPDSIISNNTESQDNNSDTLIPNSHDLLSNKVTFEMFCNKVGKTRENRKKTPEVNKISPRMLRKRRRLTVPQEQTSKSNTRNPDDDDNDDDVIFMGESLDQNRLNNTGVLENGFAGFSNEESSEVSYSVDLSNLSYNNPLKSKHKEVPNDTLSDPNLARRKPMKRKARRQNSTDLKHDKNELSFILRAAPYMNEAKLLCIPCGIIFKSFNLLLWHMSAHFSWFRYQCSKCTFISFNKYDCMLHARRQHKLKEHSAVNFILPVPNWKTVLMSHEFRLLKDCNDLKGKHTDEKIGFDESHEEHIEGNSEILESDTILFAECSRSSEDSVAIVLEKENVKRRNKSGKMVIDIQETIKDFQKLPEPLELAMPADVADVIRTFSFDESTLSPDDVATTCDMFADESNDDWGLPKDNQYGEQTNSNLTTNTDKESDNKEMVKDEKIVNIRPSRIRIKAKQNDDFLYYDNDINNVLKSTEFFKGNPQKRTDSSLPLKSKVSGRTVPTTQKKKI